MAHNAEYFRQRRRMKGIPLKADMPTVIPEHIYQTGKELAAMMMVPVRDLDWPRYLFRDVTNMVNGTQIGDKPKLGEDKCRCGKPHNNAVSRVVTEDTPWGYNRRIVWTCSWECRSKEMGLGGK